MTFSDVLTDYYGIQPSRTTIEQRTERALSDAKGRYIRDEVSLGEFEQLVEYILSEREEAYGR